MEKVTAETLNSAVEFDSPFRVNDDGTISDAYGEHYAPDVYLSESTDIEIESDDWEALTGYTGQYGYNGAVMHPSEYLGGGLARDVLDTPGVYVVVEVRDLDNDYPEGDPIGWAILKHQTA
jgi:hypothetical protein